jgi:hypothetical protein
MCNKKSKKVKDSFDAGFLAGFSEDGHFPALKPSGFCRIGSFVVLRKKATVVIGIGIIACFPFVNMKAASKR